MRPGNTAWSTRCSPSSRSDRDRVKRIAASGMQRCLLPEVGLDDPWPHLHLPECLDPPRSKEAHAWAIRSDWSWSASLEKHGSILSNDELARASKFLSPKDRDEYVLAHAMLRTIL